MIGEIERFESKLQRVILSDLRILLQREIPLRHARATEHAAAGRALANEKLGAGIAEGIDLPELVDGRVIGEWADAGRIRPRSRAGVVAVADPADAERRPAGESEDAA